MNSAFMKNICHIPMSPAPASLQSPKLTSVFCLLALGLSVGLCLLSICPSGPLNVCLFVFYLYLWQVFWLACYYLFVLNYIELLWGVFNVN